MAGSGTDQPLSFPELYRVLRAFVSQCQRARRAHPRGEISLRFNLADKKSTFSLDAGDDERMALFVVLMRPFLEKTSIIYLPRVWDSVKRGPHLHFSDVEIKNIDQALENVKKGAIAVSKDGVKIGRDEFYRILGDGSFFGSVEETSAQVREMEGSMLRSIAWFQFLTFNVDVFPIVAAIARRIVKSRGMNPLKAEITALSPSSPKCLYCLATAAKFTSEEHVYPESLAPGYLVGVPVLPVGVVCDRCNNEILSDLDKALMDFGPIALVRVQLTPFSKKGRMPSARFGNITVRKVRPRVLRFERGGKLVKVCRNLASHLCGAPGRVQRKRVREDGTEKVEVFLEVGDEEPGFLSEREGPVVPRSVKCRV